MKTKASASALLAVLAGGLALAGCANTPKTARAGANTTIARSTTAATCTEARFPIYFQPNSDQLTPESVAVIRQQAVNNRGCSVSKLDVVGLAGLEAPPAQAQQLAERRSVAVADALKAAGFAAPRFDMGAVGAEGARTPAGRRKPLRRRAEVIIYAGVQTTAAR